MGRRVLGIHPLHFIEARWIAWIVFPLHVVGHISLMVSSERRMRPIRSHFRLQVVLTTTSPLEVRLVMHRLTRPLHIPQMLRRVRGSLGTFFYIAEVVGDLCRLFDLSERTEAVG